MLLHFVALILSGKNGFVQPRYDTAKAKVFMVFQEPFWGTDSAAAVPGNAT